MSTPVFGSLDDQVYLGFYDSEHTGKFCTSLYISNTLHYFKGDQARFTQNVFESPTGTYSGFKFKVGK